MEVPATESARSALADALASSLYGPITHGTDRRVPGPVLFEGKATAVIGVRRSGKTTLVHQLRNQRLATGAPRNCLAYVNFEDERLARVKAEELGFLLEEFRRRVTTPTDRVVWSFDEIQVVDGWERFVRRLIDTGTADVVVTGSSAALLSKEIGTALRGRAWTVPLYPFSFPEALEYGGTAVPDASGRLNPDVRGAIEAVFVRWLEVGGFPEAQRLESGSRRQLLRDYVDVAMLRDVVERHRVSNVTGLRWLVRHLLSNAASLFSIEKFHRGLKSQGIAVSRDTLHDLLAHLDDCFLVRPVWMESNSERQRMVNPRKIYPVDQGLIELFDRTGRGNVGHALETAVLIECERRRCEVTYVRTPEGHEVDFLVREPDGTRHLVQVAADASAAETAERELRALVEAGRDYPDARRWLLTLTEDAAPPETPEGVTVMPAYRWMMAADWTDRRRSPRPGQVPRPGNPA